MLTPIKPVKSCECSGSCGDCCCCTKESIGLGNVDNTSDLNKPLSTDMVNALSGKVDLDIFTQLKNRVLALENTITEIPDLKVRISECELDIKDHYEAIKRLQSTTKSMADTITELGNRVTGVNDGLVTVGTRVDALETKDSNNVKLSGVNVQTIQGTLKANNPTSGATDNTLVTANWVSQTGNNAPNNLIHKTGNETILGLKKYENIQSPNIIQRNNNYLCEKPNKWCKMLTFPTGTSRNYIFIFTSVRGAWPSFGMLHVENDYGGFPRAYWIVRKYNNEDNSTFKTADSVAITRGLTEGRYDLWIKGNQAAVNGGVFIAVDSMNPLNDVNYPNEPEYVDDITQVGATNIYYAQDYPYGV